MAESNFHWLTEFVQSYEGSGKVVKRGLDATPLVIRKHGIEPDEVVAFTCWRSRHKAITAFHFHPDFPDCDRLRYMEAHEDGNEILSAIIAKAETEKRHRLEAWNERAANVTGGVKRAMHMVVGAAILALLHGQLR
ncbi:MAG: hypothetical protein V3R66_06310 [Rhodospirillales bacterium]